MYANFMTILIFEKSYENLINSPNIVNMTKYEYCKH